MIYDAKPATAPFSASTQTACQETVWMSKLGVCKIARIGSAQPDRTATTRPLRKSLRSSLNKPLFIVFMVIVLEPLLICARRKARPVPKITGLKFSDHDPNILFWIVQNFLYISKVCTWANPVSLACLRILSIVELS